MIGFIDDHRVVYGVESICRVLPVAPSTYYACLAVRADPAKASARQQRDLALRPRIKKGWDDNWQVYGVRKAWRQMCREGESAARCTVARLMTGAAGCSASTTLSVRRSGRACSSTARLRRICNRPVTSGKPKSRITGLAAATRRHPAGLSGCSDLGGRFSCDFVFSSQARRDEVFDARISRAA